MNKIIVISMLLVLSGCATTRDEQFIEPLKVMPSIEIMKACDEFVKPKDGQFSSFIQALVDNKKIYELCNSQNEAKKKFIEQLQN